MDGKSNASTLAFKEDLRNIQTLSLESSPELNQSPKSDFVDYVQSLFDIFDAEKKGYVTIDELERYLNDNEDMTKMNSKAKNLALINALQQICPANGCINFKRFNLAIQIALGKRSPGREKGIGRSLRPRSFLFAVTEVGDNDTDIKQHNGHGKEKRMSYSPADSVISSDMDESSETIGRFNSLFTSKKVRGSLRGRDLEIFCTTNGSFYKFLSIIGQTTKDLPDFLIYNLTNGLNYI